MKIFNVKDSWAKYYQSDKERQQEKKAGAKHQSLS